MATTPDKPAPASPSHPAGQPTHQPAQPAHQPPQPPSGQPGAAQPAHQPSQPAQQAKKDDDKPEEKVVEKEEAKQLFQAGHRLKKKGDPPEKWMAAVRLHNTLCLARPLDEELEKSVLDQQLVLVSD